MLISALKCYCALLEAAAFVQLRFLLLLFWSHIYTDITMYGVHLSNFLASLLTVWYTLLSFVIAFRFLGILRMQ